MPDHMTCQEVVELVTDYIEGILSDDLRMQIEHHLVGCEGCTSYVEQFRQTIKLTGQVREEDLSPEQKKDLLKLFHNWKKI